MKYIMLKYFVLIKCVCCSSLLWTQNTFVYEKIKEKNFINTILLSHKAGFKKITCQFYWYKESFDSLYRDPRFDIITRIHEENDTIILDIENYGVPYNTYDQYHIDQEGRVLYRDYICFKGATYEEEYKTTYTYKNGRLENSCKYKIFEESHPINRLITNVVYNYKDGKLIGYKACGEEDTLFRTVKYIYEGTNIIEEKVLHGSTKDTSHYYYIYNVEGELSYINGPFYGELIIKYKSNLNEKEVIVYEKIGDTNFLKEKYIYKKNFLVLWEDYYKDGHVNERKVYLYE